jgi:hypothetical protein
LCTGPIEIKHDANGEVALSNCTEIRIERPEDFIEIMEKGQEQRTTRGTKANEHSSRSHSIVSIFVRSQDCFTGAQSSGKLVLVDLAGSERISKTEATGDRLKEAQFINKSLSALGDVFSSLVSKSKHVPFRNSKLTYLLQNSLGKDNKALMICQVSPMQESHGESVCSLNFATRVGKVELGKAKKHTDGGDATLMKLKDAIVQKEVENKALREELTALQCATRDKDHTLQSMRQKCRSLEKEVQDTKESIATLTTAHRISSKRQSIATSHIVVTTSAQYESSSSSKRKSFAPIAEEPLENSKKRRKSLAPAAENPSVPPLHKSLAPVDENPPISLLKSLAPVDENHPPASTVKQERKKVTFISPTLEKPSNLKVEATSFVSRPSNLISAPTDRGAAPISLFQDHLLKSGENNRGAVPISLFRDNVLTGGENNAKDFIIRGGSDAKSSGALSNLTPAALNSPRKDLDAPMRQSKRNINNSGLKAATRIHQPPTPSRMRGATRVPTKSKGGWNPF